MLDRSATFLKKFENQEEIDYEEDAEFTIKDFEYNTHEFEELVDDTQQANSYNLRHTTKEGNTIEMTPGGRAVRSCELDDLTQNDTFSSDEDTIGFDPEGPQWVPQLPKLRKRKSKEQTQRGPIEGPNVEQSP